MKNQLPQHIPNSLKSYLEQYQDQPDTAIEKLEKHTRKRGPDAVGYYLLAWLYHFEGRKEEAIRSAWQAKIFSPGSPAMEQLHYFMTHPDNFEAWKPVVPVIRRHKKRRDRSISHPISDLDSLITRLSSVESKRIKLDMTKEDHKDLSADSSRVDDIVSETLADIHIKQKNYEAAIQTYKRLIGIHTHKKGHYKEQIKRLESKIKDPPA